MLYNYRMLSLLYIHWGDIHSKPNIFKEIDYRCTKALALRKEFPEAYQLRGNAYFRAARNQDRESSKQNNSNNLGKPIPHAESDEAGIKNPNKDELDRNQLKTLDAQKYYRFALHYYLKALRSYDLMCRKVIGYANLQGEAQGYSSNLVQQRMTTTHQIGDALRSLGRFAEAENFYRDVSYVLPQNIRNLADLAKLYCLAENWQRAEEYLWQEVFKHPIAEWDADIAIHASWSISGGIYDHQTTFVKRWIDKIIMRFPRQIPEEFQRSEKLNQLAITKQWLGTALEHLDFALYQRPRYINSWRQSNWLDPYKHAYDQLFAASSPNGLMPDRQPDKLDFALYQRPRYINSWRQSNWLDPILSMHMINYWPLVSLLALCPIGNQTNLEDSIFRIQI